MLDDALSYDGNTGPYVQYTYARTCSVLEKSGGAGREKPEKYEFSAPEEHDLLRVLSVFPERVESALEGYEPSYIARYLLDLAAAYNRFYHNCPVLTAGTESLKAQRLALTAATNKVLAAALELICVRHPEKI